jgi:hypothetical protein
VGDLLDNHTLSKLGLVNQGTSRAYLQCLYEIIRNF